MKPTLKIKYTDFRIATVLAFCVLAGCSSHTGARSNSLQSGVTRGTYHPSPPLTVFGISFRGRSRSEITSALKGLGLNPFSIGPKHWCDYWGQGSAVKRFPGLAFLRVCYTEQGVWASTTLDYANSAGIVSLEFPEAAKRLESANSIMVRGNALEPTFSGLVTSITRKYGKPAWANRDVKDKNIDSAIWALSSGEITVTKMSLSVYGTSVSLTLSDQSALTLLNDQKKAAEYNHQSMVNPLTN